VIVAGPVIVAVHVHGNAPVSVIERFKRVPRMENSPGAREDGLRPHRLLCGIRARVTASDVGTDRVHR
jgi:hypothetical protein